MADTIPDLWPTSALKIDVRPPIAILRAQATRLAQNTQGILVGEVTTTRENNGQVALNFDVIAPALNNYRHRLLKVQYAHDATFPTTVFAGGLTTTEMVRGYPPLSRDRTVVKPTESKIAYSEQGFIQMIQEVLQAPETVALLQSLIVRSNESANDLQTSDAEDESAEDEAQEE